MNAIKEVVGCIYFLVAWNVIFGYNRISHSIGKRFGFKYTRTCEGLYNRVR